MIFGRLIRFVFMAFFNYAIVVGLGSLLVFLFVVLRRAFGF